MKYGVFGDIHGNLEALQAVLEECERLGVDSYICIGDIVGYGASPHECLSIIRDLVNQKRMVVVKGNHDEVAAEDTPVEDFNPRAAIAINWTRQMLSTEERQWLANLPYREMIRPYITAVHATLDSPKEWGYILDRYNAEASMSYQLTPVCFCGHSHVPCVYEKRCEDAIEESEVDIKPLGKYLINVGSVGQPRDKDYRACFVIFDTDFKRVTYHRVDYDIETSAQKIIDAGLPESLATRLRDGT